MADAEAEKAKAELYQSLVAKVKAEEYDEALETADALLDAHGDAEAVVRTRILCLIHEGDFEDAIAAIDANPALGMDMEKAYALYSLHQSAEALKAVSKLGASDATRHLEAQTRYRLGEYDAALEIYDGIKSSGEDSSDFKANLLAAYAKSSRSAEGAKIFKGLGLDTYEGVFNGACVQINEGLLDDARDTLVAAQKMGQEQLEMDDYEPEDIEAELAVLDVQLAYVEQLQGDNTDAAEAYSSVIHKKPDDAAVLAVARNNLVACKGERDLFDGFKHMKSAANTPEKKLQAYQKKVIGTNHALVLLFMGKNKDCREAIDKLSAQFPKDEQVVVLFAALAYRQKNFKKCETTLVDFIDAASDECVLVQLTLAQFHINQRSLKAAADTLLAIESLNHEPGLVATVVNLMDQLQDKPGALQVLDAAVAHWQAEKDAEKLSTLLKECAAWKLKRGMSAEALETYSQLIKLQPDNHGAVASAIVAAAHINPELAKKYQQMLPPLTAADGFDGEELEASVAPRVSRGKKVKAGAEAAAAAAGADAAEVEAAGATAAAQAAAARKAAKKKKKIRYPKNYNPENPGTPDPERWVPRRERAGAKKSRKRRNAPLAKGDQGAGNMAGMSDKEKAKIAALDKSDKKGSSADATTGSAREGEALSLYLPSPFSLLHFSPSLQCTVAPRHSSRCPGIEESSSSILLHLTCLYWVHDIV